MSKLEKSIRHDSRKFRELLPSLMTTYSGKWVVFRSEEVVSAHATEREAYMAGVSKFGEMGGFVVAIVAESKPTPINVAAAFGLARA